MNILTPEQRASALRALATAPDEILLSAMVDYKAHNHRLESVKRNFDETCELLNAAATGASSQTPNPTTSAEAPSAPVAAAPRPNVSPGVPGIGKIGGNTKTDILDTLSAGLQSAPRFAEHLKLLWSRGEVKFDGKEYYL